MSGPIHPRDLLVRELPAGFVRQLAIDIGWGYADLTDEMIKQAAYVDADFLHRRYSERRNDVVIDALVRACVSYEVPYEFRHIPGNAQKKLLISAGRLLILQEPMNQRFGEAPRASDYKRALARTFAYVQQLELPLGDVPRRITDWSGRTFGVLLHGSAGKHFSSGDMQLGALALAVPDGAYSRWETRVDLWSAGVLGGSVVETDEPASTDAVKQQDNVEVRLRDSANVRGYRA